MRVVGRVMVDWLGLPADVVRDLPRVVLLGREEVVVSNHRGLERYAPGRILIRSSVGAVLVEGDGLRVASITAESIRVRGRVHGVRVGG